MKETPKTTKTTVKTIKSIFVFLASEEKKKKILVKGCNFI